MNLFFLPITILALSLITATAAAAPIALPSVNVDIASSQNPEDLSATIQLMVALTVLTIAPSILLMTTAFIRIVVVLSFLRQAMSTQTTPPNMIIISLALFMTFYIMAPYWTEMNDNGLQPYLNGQITQEQALENIVNPMREFMFKQTRESDLALFVNLADAPRPESQEDVSTFTLIPAFVISELKTAFQIGFMIYIPFIVIDMIVATTLMSMGMMMLPPVMISLPFKILLFVMVDGWHLLIQSLITSFK